MAQNPFQTEEEEVKERVCMKCGRLKKGTEFYVSRNFEKYPGDHRIDICKDCLTMYVDSWDPATFLPILEELDVPYDKESWDKLLAKYGQDPTKMTGKTILGHYLAVMKLKQWKDKHYADTARIEEEKRAAKEIALKAAGYTGEEIEQFFATDRTPERAEIVQHAQDTRWRQEMSGAAPSAGSSVTFAERQRIEDEIGAALTEEDKRMLGVKWGYAYKPSEWVQLEQLYNDMMESYDIQGAGHIDTLKLVCKTSLKANQMLDMGDIENYQKMSKTYDALMKSGKFTAAQNKADSAGMFDSVSELVALCEKEGFIPRYYTDGPQDKVDLVLKDMQQYTHTLVTEELNLGNLIENSMKMIQDQMIKENQIDVDDEELDEDELYERSLFDVSYTEVTDEDYDELREQEELDEEQDYEYITKMLSEEVY